LTKILALFRTFASGFIISSPNGIIEGKLWFGLYTFNISWKIRTVNTENTDGLAALQYEYYILDIIHVQT
jgi:hypothetical protein